MKENKFTYKENIIEVHNLSFPKNTNIGIYGLYKNNKLIYIGKSVNIKNRVYQHKQNKDFNAYKILLCCKKHELDFYEQYFVSIFNPEANLKKFNTVRYAGKRTSKYLNIKEVKRKEYPIYNEDGSVNELNLFMKIVKEERKK